MVDIQTDNESLSDIDGVDDGEKTMPLGSGAEGVDGGMMQLGASTGRKRRFNSGGAVIALVIAVAAVGLYSLRTITKVSAGSDSSAKNEQLIESFLTAMSKDGSDADSNGGFSEELVVLNDDLSDHQVALADVQKDPFILPGAVDGGGGTTNIVDPPLTLIDERRRARKQLFEQAAAKLRLKSIMVGSDPLANVSGQIVRVNDSFVVQAGSEAVEFRVVGINKEAIEIMAEDTELSLAVIVAVPLSR